MSRMGNSDCNDCGVWIAECCCDEPYPYDNSGDAIDAAQSQVEAMQEECSNYFATLFVPEQDNEQIPF